MIQNGLPQCPVKRRQRHRGRVAGVTLTAISWKMRVNVTAVVVRGFARGLGIVARLIRGLWHSAGKTKQIHQAQSNQHKAYGKLHPKPQPGRNNQLEKDNSRAHHNNRQRMADPPEHTCQGCPRQVALAADDCCYRDDMIRIGGVPHPEEKSQCDDREQTDHFCRTLVRTVPVTLVSRAVTRKITTRVFSG